MLCDFGDVDDLEPIGLQPNFWQVAYKIASDADRFRSRFRAAVQIFELTEIILTMLIPR